MKLCSYRAAAASWFLRLGELGSVERALAANNSLLDDMEMVFRLDTTWVWSSLDWRWGGGGGGVKLHSSFYCIVIVIIICFLNHIQSF